MDNPILTEQLMSRNLYKDVPTEDGKDTQRVPDGIEMFYYSVSIDEARLQDMSIRAARNKSGICRAGALIIKVTERKKL